MKKHRTDRILAIDTEWTCWDGEPPPGMRSELIEIGIVEADPSTLEIVRERSFLVRPLRSRVSPYCEELTGISEDLLRTEGRPLAEVLRTLAKEFGPSRKAAVAWGDDWGGIDGECRAAGLDNPFPRELALNFGLIYAIAGGCLERPALEQVVEAEGLGFDGRQHRAVPDATATMRLFLAFSARQRMLPNPGSPSP
jgi:inhibitor of KinA sporulation pathway (predicted exonuclease)